MERTNVDIHDNEDFSRWAFREGLELEEDYLISKCFPAEKKESKIVEAGCGNGRILLELHKRGFKNLYGFDLSDKLLESARKQAARYGCDINVSKQNAVSLNYPSDYFDSAIYLQQILSLIETKEDRKRTIDECYRILRKGGVGIMSFLWWEGRMCNIPLAILKSLTRLCRKGDIEGFRKFRYLPWLRMGGKTNLKWITEDQPYTYWFKKDEVVSLLTLAGFKILEISSSKTIMERQNKRIRKGQGLYVVVQK